MTFTTDLLANNASDAGLRKPCAAAAPANINSSTAIDPIIPNVYALFNKRLFVKPNAPPLLELPIAIASSNSKADSKSGCDK